MPNDPYLDASVAWRIKSGTLDLHEAGYRTTEEAILSSGLAMEVVGLVSAGKEADVYLALYRDVPIAIKVYRLYRSSHRGGGPIKHDSAGWLAAKEYEMTRQAWKGGCDVPAPARRIENMFSMRYLGDDDGPAPRLSDVHLENDDEFLRCVMLGVEKLAKAGVVHTDLSPFNILVYQHKPWFIDFSEAIRVDRTDGSPWMRFEQAKSALDATMRSFSRYFTEFDDNPDYSEFALKILKSLDKFNVLD